MELCEKHDNCYVLFDSIKCPLCVEEVRWTESQIQVEKLEEQIEELKGKTNE